MVKIVQKIAVIFGLFGIYSLQAQTTEKIAPRYLNSTQIQSQTSYFGASTPQAKDRRKLEPPFFLSPDSLHPQMPDNLDQAKRESYKNTHLYKERSPYQGACPSQSYYYQTEDNPYYHNHKQSSLSPRYGSLINQAWDIDWDAPNRWGEMPSNWFLPFFSTPNHVDFAEPFTKNMRELPEDWYF